MLRRALLALLFLPAMAAGQTFERFGVRDGLSAEAVVDLEVGPEGFLWVATEDGLSRYDGHAFRTWRHRPGRPETLPASRLGAVLAGDDGTVWVGSVRGLSRLDRRTGRFDPVPGLPARAYVTSLARDGRGRIWIGTNDHGLWRHDPPAPERVLSEAGRSVRVGMFSERLENVRVIALAEDDGDVWVSAFHTLHEGSLCHATADTLDCREDIAAVGIKLLFDGQGEAILFTRGTFSIHWPRTGATWPGPPYKTFRVALRVRPQELWLGSQAGIVTSRSDGTYGRITPDPDRRGGLGGFDIRALARDRQGSIWVGTESGLYVTRSPSGPFETFRRDADDPRTLSDDRVNGMAERDGTLWVTTNNGLNRIDLETGRVQRLPVRAPPEDFPDYTSAFWQILITRDGEVLVGGKRHGILALEDGQLRPVARPPIGHAGIRGLTEDSRGRVWASAEGAVLRRDPGGRFRQIPASPDAGPMNVVYQARSGEIWVGTDRGLLLHDDRRDRLDYVRVGCEPEQDAVNIWAMVETPADPGALWLASTGNGLVRYHVATGEATCADLTWGLPTDAVSSVLTDDDGMIWAGTSAGLVRLDPMSREVTTFTSADGLHGDAFHMMGALRLSDGRLAFGGPGGLTLVDPSAVGAREAPATVVSGFERAGRLDTGTPLPGDTLRLPHDVGTFGIRFAAADFRSPGRTRYRYRLVGLEDEWQWTDGSAPRAAFAGVPPGAYRFEVMAAAVGTGYGEPTSIWVEIEPAVWQRWWFRWGLGLLAVGLVAGVATSRVRRKAAETARREADTLEVRRRLADARERERLRLARDLHDGPVQTLYSVGHDLDRLGEAGAEVGPVRGRVGDVATSLRQMLVELRPTLAEHLGLGPALRTVSRHAQERWPSLSITVRDETGGAAPTDAGRVALFRIAQQAFDNAGRHAGEAHVEVVLEAAAGGIRLTVRDDGRGFEVPDRMVDLARQEHFGLVGSQERAESVGGTFKVRSAPGAGTTIEAWAPLG